MPNILPNIFPNHLQHSNSELIYPNSDSEPTYPHYSDTEPTYIHSDTEHNYAHSESELLSTNVSTSYSRPRISVSLDAKEEVPFITKDMDNIGSNPHHDYFIDRNHVLGVPGQFGTAFEARHLNSGEIRAVKVIEKTRWIRKGSFRIAFGDFAGEIMCLRKLHHPNLVRLFDVYETSSHLYLAFENLRGGELFDLIAEKCEMKNLEGSVFPEHEAAGIMRQILEGVGHMHSSGICHLDLKPANIMFSNKGEGAVCKIIDFGFSRMIPKWKDSLSRPCGTPYYIAPEVLHGSYREGNDCWSIGVILFALLYGFTPFQGEDGSEKNGNSEVYDRILSGFNAEVLPGVGPHFPSEISVSEEARDLVANLLKTKTAERYTCQQALMHPFICGSPETGDFQIPKPHLHAMRRFKTLDSLTLAVTTRFKQLIDQRQRDSIIATFRKIDTEGIGMVDFPQFRAFLSSHTSDSPMEIHQYFLNLDQNMTGYLTSDNLLLAVAHYQLVCRYERVDTLFKRLDNGKKGHLDRHDFRKLCKAIRHDPIVEKSELPVDLIMSSVGQSIYGRVMEEDFLFHLNLHSWNHTPGEITSRDASDMDCDQMTNEVKSKPDLPTESVTNDDKMKKTNKRITRRRPRNIGLVKLAKSLRSLEQSKTFNACTNMPLKVTTNIIGTLPRNALTSAIRMSNNRTTNQSRLIGGMKEIIPIKKKITTRVEKKRRSCAGNRWKSKGLSKMAPFARFMISGSVC